MDIVCFGDLMVESFLNARNLPEADSTLILDQEFEENLGGSVLNVAWYLSQLGNNPKIVSFYGQEESSLVKESLASGNLNSSGLIKISGKTDRLIAFLTPKNHHSVYLRSKLPSDIQDKLRGKLNKTSKLLLTGSRHKSIRKLSLELLQDQEISFKAFAPSYSVYDHGKSELLQAIKSSNLVAFNESEAGFVSDLLEFNDFNKLSTKYSVDIIITYGKQGATLYCPNKEETEISTITSVGKKVIGGGDAFLAGYLHQIFKGATPKEAGDFAMVISAFVAEGSGLRLKISKEEIDKRFSEFRNISW